MSEQVYLSLGSNLGDREANLASAITALNTFHEIHHIQSASFYESDPLYNTDQPPFLNTVVSLQTDFTPFQLLDAIHYVEQLLGRPSSREKNMPRTIDVDILCFGTAVIETKELTIPHADLVNRRFVLIPLNELNPDLIIPVWNQPVRTLLTLCPDTSQVQKHPLEKNA